MIEIKNVTHVYKNNQVNFKALDNIKINIVNNRFNILFGKSGSGKTTLLNVIGGLLQPTDGEVVVNGLNIYKMNDMELSNYRKDYVGFVFQNFFLEDNFTALENVLIPLFLEMKMTKEQRTSKAIEVLERVGLGDKIYYKPTELSGGECQRVAIARALANDPTLIIADEPTGNLDAENGKMIVALLRKQIELGSTVLLVTHDSEFIENNDVVYNIVDGRI